MNHIVIGVDGSPAATAAARWAACEAAMRDVELTIVHVLRSAPDALAVDGMAGDPTTGRGRRRPTCARGEDPRRHVGGHRQDHRCAATPQYRQQSLHRRRRTNAVRLQPQGIADDRGWPARPRAGYIVLCSAQSAAACCTMRTARSRWSTTTCQRFHRAQHRLSWASTARPPPSQRSRSPSMKPRDAAWTGRRARFRSRRHIDGGSTA